MKRKILCLIVILSVLSWNIPEVRAFCGFYVARAETKLFNEASKVVLVRDGDRTVLTMANDFRGELSEFAIVIPVPTLIKKEQIHVANGALIDHLDAYTAPRLVEYYDENPCDQRRIMKSMAASGPRVEESESDARALQRGVKIEARYTVGEYDILILSAEQSSGLETWLKEEGYKIPDGASEVLGSYLGQNMKFFVAKVNIEEQKKLGISFLRPLQVAYESPKFMLPIRLGMVNANGPQELFIFTLTKKGRVETTNYRTVKLPEGVEIPEYVKETFGDFYKALFSQQVKKEGMNTVFLEYAWDMGWCDPCAAEPLQPAELKELGVFWLDSDSIRPRVPIGGMQGGSEVFVTRLHVRYDKEHFPEDLTFQETADRSNFQGRFVLRHPWTGTETCEAADMYRKELPMKKEKEAAALASLTGWDVSDIRSKMKLTGEAPKGDENWWKGIWK